MVWLGIIASCFSILLGAPMLGSLATVVGISILTPKLGAAAYETVPSTDVTAIAKWAGLYAKQMINQTLNGLDIMADVAVDRLVSRHGKLLPKFTAQGGMRPLNTNVEDNGRKERTFSGRKLFVFDGMKLFKIIPEDLRTSYLSDMLQPGAKDIPFAQWVWEKEMEKLASEINDNAYLSKKVDAEDYDAGEAYVANTDYVVFGATEDIYKCITNAAAGESPLTHPAKWQLANQNVTLGDGFGTIIAAEIVAGNVPAVATGAITNNNALTKFELMYNSMTVPHRNKGGIFRCAPDVFRAYIENERSVYTNTNTAESGDGKKYIYGSGKKWEIRECTWMGESGRVIATQFDNLQVGTNLKDNPGLTNVVQTLHGYKAVAKFLFGMEIADLENLYVNDQA